MAVDEVRAWLDDEGVAPGEEVAVALAPGVGLGLATATGTHGWHVTDPAAVITAADAELDVRWVWWDAATAHRLAGAHIAVTRCWDVTTVHRLLRGGWRTSIGELWAWLHDLPADGLPRSGQLGLLDPAGDDGDDPEDPVRPDGHLRPEWLTGGWAASPTRLATWAATALAAAHAQRARLAARPDPARALSTARSESAAEFVCAELARDGLPIDVAALERIVADAIGPRPRNSADEAASREHRDEAVLRHVPAGPRVDLRSPADVRAMLRRAGVDVPDTRAWRLEQHRNAHPVVDALLTWRKAERIATTYGYRWLDEHVHDGRLRGEWSSCDGAAGRMTASAGLHNLPAELRPAVAAEAGHAFVRADLGQIEPRVLAAVSSDPALIVATRDDDLYEPIATRLGVARDIAKVAVLGAMYGSTTGTSAAALQGLARAYPVAMGLLERAAAAGRTGEDVYTIGGRRVRMWSSDGADDDADINLERARSAAAARGRYARNALIQGAAAELFKVWALTVRARTRELGAQIVLCLHDELLVHTPLDQADGVATAVRAALDEAAYRWSPHRDVRFVADVSVIERWSDAK